MKIYKSPMSIVGGNEGAKCFHRVRLDTYGRGCQHDCSYCYAKSLLDFRRLWDPAEPAVASLKDIEKAILKAPAGEVIRLGGMTDCYMPLERKTRRTREAIKLLNKHRREYLIVTKSDIILDDLNILDKELAHIQITITTTNDSLARTYEKATLPSARIQVVEKLQAEGFDIAVRLSPYIPEFVSIDEINAIKCDKIIIEFLRVNTFIRKQFDIDYSDYIVNRNGYNHLSLKKKKELIKGIDYEEASVCEDESIAYAYWKYHYNNNPNDCCNLRRKTHNADNL